MNPRYYPVAERAEHRCEYCRAPEIIFNFPFEVEHIHPSSKGGAGDDSNTALACRACNSFKSDYFTGIDSESSQEVELFHSRRHSWSDHFRFNPASAMIEGVTPAGRATAARLRFNSPLQLATRLVWIELGLFA